MKYFKLSEFECPCCKKNKINKELLGMLDEARELAGIPFKISSGYRCVKHNKAVGGVPNSSHLVGKAVDIKGTGQKQKMIIQALRNSGFLRLGIARTFVHADIDHSKPIGTWYY
ncbi:MAG: D-Ala-D-Ala carboxypeptidase family metallohydrolase [Methylococcales bacterium]|nr:D-Ala-D-Ala carboxypeptidase family metallohydrolase [Methylococcales bacterium]